MKTTEGAENSEIFLNWVYSHHSIEFPFCEVLVVVRGGCDVRFGGKSLIGFYCFCDDYICFPSGGRFARYTICPPSGGRFARYARCTQRF